MSAARSLFSIIMGSQIELQLNMHSDCHGLSLLCSGLELPLFERRDCLFVQAVGGIERANDRDFSDCAVLLHDSTQHDDALNAGPDRLGGVARPNRLHDPWR